MKLPDYRLQLWCQTLELFAGGTWLHRHTATLGAVLNIQCSTITHLKLPCPLALVVVYLWELCSTTCKRSQKAAKTLSSHRFLYWSKSLEQAQAFSNPPLLCINKIPCNHKRCVSDERFHVLNWHHLKKSRECNDRHEVDPAEHRVAIYYSFDLRLGVAGDDWGPDCLSPLWAQQPDKENKQIWDQRSKLRHLSPTVCAVHTHTQIEERAGEL